MNRVHNSLIRQQGLALITAMLIVAIVAALAASLALGQQVWLQQTTNISDMSQADNLCRGALRFAAVVLAKDAKNNKTDDLTEDWATPLPPLPVEGGAIMINVYDAQGRFNLNNLVRSDAPSPADIGVFQQLLLANGLRQELSDALVDWIDSNTHAQPDGAEDIDYLKTSTPYRTANQMLASVDELRLIKGFTEKSVEKLRPYVTTLPEPTAININTAPAAVLAALVPNATLQITEQLVQQREQTPFTESAQLAQRLPEGYTLPQASYDVRSSYFIVTVDARIGRIQRRMEALLQRPPNGQAVKILWQGQPAPRIEFDENT